MVAIVVFSVLALMIISIVGMSIWHTQEMTKLKGAKGDSGLSKSEMASIRSEVTELRQMITSLAINVENMKDNYVHVSALEDRMKVGE